MIFWTANPEIYRYFPTELTEPIFLLGLTSWTWAIVNLVLSPKPSRRLTLVAAVGLCITLLSRPVLQLIAPLGLAICLGLLTWNHIRGNRPYASHVEQQVRTIAISLALGILIPLLLIIKNGVMFDLWKLGTGAGTGLYLGTNPLFQGAEPAFLGFSYDNNSLAQITSNTGDHLDLKADRIAQAVGIWQIQSMPPKEACTFFARKLWWWLAHHPASLQLYGSTLRKLRLLEISSLALMLVLMACIWLRSGTTALAQFLPDADHPPRPRLAAAALVLLLFSALLAQLLPILYNSRYSTALLDPWLIVLAAFSMAVLFAPLKLKVSTHSLVLLTVGRIPLIPALLIPIVPAAVTSITFNYAKRHEIVAIDQPAETRTLFELPADRITTMYLTPLASNHWVMNEDVAVLSLDLSTMDLKAIESRSPINAIWRMNLALTRKSGKCKPSDVAYQLSDGRILDAYVLPLNADGQMHTAYIHGNRTLRPTQPGRLRIVLKCPAGTEITWAGAAFLSSIHPQIAAQRIRVN
jgi:hypothetical protein